MSIPALLSKQRVPRQRVPLHLLCAVASGSTQVRCYSSSPSRNSNDRGVESSDGNEAASEPGTSLASGFGFQSLSGLLRRSAPAQRSRSTTATGTSVQGVSESSLTAPDIAESGNGTPRSEPSGAGSQHFSTLEPVSGVQDKTVFNSPGSRVPQVSEAEYNKSKLVRFENWPSPMQRSMQRSAINWRRSRQGSAVTSRRSEAARGTTPRSIPGRQVLNPFLRKHIAARDKRASTEAWGLNKETPEPLVEPPAEESPSDTSQSATDRYAANPASASSEDIATSSSRAKLTHVNPTGEAHMVDVGSKPNSRRVAIAFGWVYFSNSKPFQLIFENNNKKGDVLGVARISGIMAAKRTSDLIPLCHPLALSKVEVDVKLHAPKFLTSMLGKNEHGMVTIQAHVETTGPTGVEMEALTAVSAASLTVYDMCKAVDRSMRISAIALRYKSGGNSGLFYDENWAFHVGKEYFTERKLEIPNVKKWHKEQETEDS